MEQDRHCLAENVKPIVNAALSWGGQQRLQCLHHDGAAILPPRETYTPAGKYTCSVPIVTPTAQRSTARPPLPMPKGSPRLQLYWLGYYRT